MASLEFSEKGVIKMSYFGGKGGSGAFQKIIAMMPRHDTYIEMFLGSGVILGNKPAARTSIALDKSAAAIGNFNYEVPNLELINACSIEFIADFSYGGRDVFIYADPPYLLETRSSTVRYDYEISDQDHKRMLDILKSAPAKVLISGYPSKLYDIELEGWKTTTYQSMTRGGIRTEQLWWNYNEADAYSHAYAGKNFTHRQQVKRKAERWAKKFRLLSQAEQIAILNRLLDL